MLIVTVIALVVLVLIVLAGVFVVWSMAQTMRAADEREDRRFHETQKTILDAHAQASQRADDTMKHLLDTLGGVVNATTGAGRAERRLDAVNRVLDEFSPPHYTYPDDGHDPTDHLDLPPPHVGAMGLGVDDPIPGIGADAAGFVPPPPNEVGEQED